MFGQGQGLCFRMRYEEPDSMIYKKLHDIGILLALVLATIGVGHCTYILDWGGQQLIQVHTTSIYVCLFFFIWDNPFLIFWGCLPLEVVFIWSIWKLELIFIHVKCIVFLTLLQFWFHIGACIVKNGNLGRITNSVFKGARLSFIRTPISNRVK